MGNNNYENITNIIIPARKYDDILCNSIKKIRQLYKKIKIILVLDDTDIPNDSIPDNVIVLQSKSYRMSAKRNQGVCFDDCEYIAFLDSDAYPTENWLNCAIDFLNNNKDYSAVFGPWYNAEDDSFEQHCTRIQRFIPLFSRKEWWKLIDPKAKDQDAKEFISASVILRRKDFINADMMNENIYINEDIEFSKRFINKGYKIRFLSDMTVYHRESKIYAYLRKIFICGYYYANMLYKGHYQKELKCFEKYFQKDAVYYMAPLVLSVIYLLTFCLFLIFKLPLHPLFIIALIALSAIMFSCIKACFLLKENRIKGFILLLCISLMFCFVYVISTILGLFNIRIKSIYKTYKQ